MKRTFIALSFLFVFVLACFAADINGNWKGTVKTPDGNDLEIIYYLKAEGENLTGKVEAENLGAVPLLDGKIKGQDFNFKLKLGNTIMENQGKMFSDSIVIKTLVQGNTFQNTFKRVVENK